MPSKASKISGNLGAVQDTPTSDDNVTAARLLVRSNIDKFAVRTVPLEYPHTKSDFREALFMSFNLKLQMLFELGGERNNCLQCGWKQHRRDCYLKL